MAVNSKQTIADFASGIVKSHGEDRSQLNAILRDIQVEYNYLPEQALRDISELLEIPLVDIYGVATFYTSYSLEPKGKNIVTVCMGTACHVRNSPGVLDEICRLMLAECASSRTLQCLASEYGVTEVRFKSEDRGCILCGLCVRMCGEQMMGGAIGFTKRGIEREISMPFHKTSEACRECGAYLFICPVCELPCKGPLESGELCNARLDTSQIGPFPSKD